MERSDFLAAAGIMSIQTDTELIVLDVRDLNLVGAATAKLLAEGHSITPDMLPILLDRER